MAGRAHEAPIARAIVHRRSTLPQRLSSSPLTHASPALSSASTSTAATDAAMIERRIAT